MTEWFFYQDRGTTAGPITLDEMRARVRDGRLRAFDLIYKEGESAWKMAMEHHDLRDVFREAGQSVTAGRPWVCLRRKGEETFDFVTDGPFSDDEIRSGLASGRLGYNDYVWRDGYQDWKRIGGVSTFNPRADKAPPAPPPKTKSAGELLGNVVELKRSGLPTEPPPPPEADPLDLTDPGVPESGDEENTRIIMPRPSARRPVAESGPPPPPPTRTKNPAAKPTASTQTKSVKVAPEAFDPEKTRVKPDAFDPEKTRVKPEAFDPEKTRVGSSASFDPDKTHVTPMPEPGHEPTRVIPAPTSGPPPFIPRTPRREEIKAKRTRDWGIVAALAIMTITLTVFFLQRRARDHAARVAVAAPPAPPPAVITPPPAAPDATSSPPPVAAPGTTAVTEEDDVPDEPAAPAPKKPAAPREPTRLMLTAQTSGGQGRVDVRTNLPADAPVYVQIVGAAGQVTDAAAYYKYVRAVAPGSMGKAVELPGVQLGAGSYQISVEAGGERKQTSLNVAMNDQKTKAALARQRKLAAGAIWSERLHLFGQAGAVLSAVQKAQTRPIPGRDFHALDQVRRTTGEKYLFFAEWWELKQIVEEGRRKVTPELVAKAKGLYERVATLSVWRTRP